MTEQLSDLWAQAQDLGAWAWGAGASDPHFPRAVWRRVRESLPDTAAGTWAPAAAGRTFAVDPLQLLWDRKAKQHLIAEVYRIPRHYPASLRRLLQLAYTLGQLRAAGAAGKLAELERRGFRGAAEIAQDLAARTALADFVTDAAALEAAAAANKEAFFGAAAAARSLTPRRAPRVGLLLALVVAVLLVLAFYFGRWLADKRGGLLAVGVGLGAGALGAVVASVARR